MALLRTEPTPVSCRGHLAGGHSPRTVRTTDAWDFPVRSLQRRRAGAVVTASVVLFAAVVVAPAAAAADRLCDGKEATILGTSGRDIIVGTDGPDVIVGLGGPDRIRGATGDDLICGGRGTDRLVGGPGNDRIFGQGNGYKWGGEFGDTMDGGPGDDLMDGGGGPPLLDLVTYRSASSGITVNGRRGTAHGASSGTDQLVGVNRVWGTEHDDRFVHVFGVLAGDGDDLVRGAISANGESGDDVMIGRPDPVAHDGLRGGPGADVLRGRAGPDSLLGEEGDDFLHGGPGEDLGNAGEGTDTWLAIEDRIDCELTTEPLTLTSA